MDCDKKEISDDRLNHSTTSGIAKDLLKKFDDAWVSPPKSKEQQLIEHLYLIQDNFTKSLKFAYFSGFRDARDEGYLGCDVLSRWESSDIKEEIEKNEQ